MHECRCCGKLKKEDEFPTQKKCGFRGDSSKVTRRLDCRVCVAEAAREYRRTHKSTPKVKLAAAVDKYLWSAIGCRLSDARARGNCYITQQELYDVFMKQDGKCALSGATLTTEKKTHNVLSLDQIVAGNGYRVGNVQWVTWAVNRAKGDMTLPDFLSMCKSIIGRCNDYPEREYSQVAGSAQHSEE